MLTIKLMQRIYVFFILLSILNISCKEKEVQEKVKFPFTGDTKIDAISAKIAEDPLNPTLRFARAEALFNKNMYEECIADLRVAITADSLKPEYYHLLSNAFMDNQLSSKALQTMEVAKGLFPNRIPTMLKLSETQLIVKQYDKAIQTLNDVVRLDPQNAEAYFMIGTTLNQMGEKQRAINAFQTATEMDSKLIDAWISLGNIYLEKKDRKAQQYYEAAVNSDPKNVNAAHALAYYFQSFGDDQKAISLYKEITKSHPKYVDAFLNCGILYLEKDSLDQAYEMFNIMVGTEPKDWAGYYYRGKVLYAKGKLQDALNDFRSSRNLNDTNKEAEEMIAKIESKIGKK